MEQLANWNIEAMTGYKPKTTFYTDFSIADHYGKKAIGDTFNRAFDEWQHNTEYVTELAMVLNWKSWEHYDKGNEEYTYLYSELFHLVDDWCLENLKGDDVKYYLRTTD